HDRRHRHRHCRSPAHQRSPRALLAVPNLAVGKNAVEKTVPEALEGCADARDFGNVDAGADDHGFKVAQTRARPWWDIAEAVLPAQTRVSEPTWSVAGSNTRTPTSEIRVWGHPPNTC